MTTPPSGAITPHTPEYHVRLLVGDFVVQIAVLRARVATLEEEVAALRTAAGNGAVRPAPA